MGCVATAGNNSNKIVSAESNHLPRKKTKRKIQAIDNRVKSYEIIDAMSAVISTKQKSPKDISLISSSINKIFLFTNLTKDQKNLIVQEMKHYSLAASSVVFEQSCPGNTFFVVSKGKLEVRTDDLHSSYLKPGDSFGEAALLHESLRQSSVKTVEASEMWGLDRQTYRKIVYSINSLLYKENKTFIQNVGIFHILTNEQQDILINSLSTQQFQPGIYIVREGETGELFYLIKEGRVSVQKNGQEIRVMNKGDYFGEQALLYTGNRTASVLTLAPTVCLSIDSVSLILALGSHLENIIYKNSLKISFEKDENLKKLNTSQIEKLSEAVKVKKCVDGEVIREKGSAKNELLIVLRGTLVYGDLKFDLFDCAFSQDFCLNIEGVYEKDLVAGIDSDIGQVSIDEFQRAIGGDYKEIALENEIISSLKKVPILSSMSVENLGKILKVMKVFEYQENSTVFEENSTGEFFFIIKQGELQVINNNSVIRNLMVFDYFGERSLLFNSPRTATIKTLTRSELWTLTQVDFLALFPESVKSRLIKQIELQDTSIQLEDLSVIRLIGKGMFGNVFLVVHKSKQSLYALKCISKRKIIAYSVQNNVKLERKVLMLLNHPMIMKLVKTFKDENQVYFLLEYVVGMDLFEVLKRLNILSDTDARFYTVCLILILEHIHSKGIIYRDLKPENIVIDSEGYPKLIDFGISNIVNGRSFTLVGTPHYMSPEMIEGKGYSNTADFWSLGIMIYEFVCAAVPFGDDFEEPYAIYEKILEHKLVFPPWVEENKLCRSFIEQLLNKNPGLRLGGNNIKDHQWFFGVNWEKALSKQIKTPFIPIVKDKLDQNGMEVREAALKEERNDEVRNYGKAKEFDVNWDEEF